MFKFVRRVSSLKNNFNSLRRILYSNNASPSISVTPAKALVDQKVTITLSGLQPNQLVTFVANVEENAVKFESRAVYRADESGCIDNREAYSLAGTFIGNEPMGLFWSMRPEKYATRFMKKDVSVPSEVNIRVFDGAQEEGECSGVALVSTCAERMFMGPGVRRIPVKVGRIRGTVFIPEGEGPFPAVMDTYGGLVALIEVRAALLASHGYATFALSYIHGEGLPQTIMKASINYIQAAFEWFRSKDYVDETRLGLLGLCYGGFLFFQLASLMPEVKAVVNVNGLAVSLTPDVIDLETFDVVGQYGWPNPDLVYKTEEGVVIRDAFDMEDPYLVPAWQNGAKILLIGCGDDLQVHPKWHHYAVEKWPPEYRCNMRSFFYPGAGHMLEFPYMPYARVIKPGRSRMLNLEFVPKRFADDYFMGGGYPQQHAHAQEDAWQRILHFLDTTL